MRVLNTYVSVVKNGDDVMVGEHSCDEISFKQNKSKKSDEAQCAHKVPLLITIFR